METVAARFTPFDTRALLPKGNPSPEIQALVAGFPVVAFAELIHRGDPAEHKPECDSLEGCLLSVSEHPEEWSEIARTLKGSDYVVRAPAGNLRLVDVLRIPAKKRAALRKLGVRLGLAYKTKGYKISWWDEDSEDTRFFTTCDKAEADAEGGEEGRTVTKETIYMATPKLAAYWGLRHQKTALSSLDTINALVACLTEWSGAFHGLWWENEYDPANLSCPRGGIFQSILPQLECSILEA